MADPKIPKRLRILRALTDKLKEITPANGYQHDLSDAVFRGRAQFGHQDPVPMLAVLQSPRTLESLPPPGQGGTLYYGPLELLIQGFCIDDFEHPTDPAEMLMAEVKQCLAGIAESIQKSPSMTWREITKLSIGPGVCRPPDEEVSAKAYFWLSVTIEYGENVKDPYAASTA